MIKKIWLVEIGICVFFALMIVVGFTEKDEIQQNNNLTIPEIAGIQGCYLPKNQIIIGNHKFEYIEILSDEKKVEKIFVLIKDKEKRIKDYECEKFIIKSNRLVIKPTSTIIGNISFEGFFLPVENGYYAGTSENKIVVLKGKFVITKGGKNLYLNNNQEFTFLYGD